MNSKRTKVNQLDMPEGAWRMVTALTDGIGEPTQVALDENGSLIVSFPDALFTERDDIKEERT